MLNHIRTTVLFYLQDSDGEEKWVEKTKDSGKEKQAPPQPTPVVKASLLQCGGTVHPRNSSPDPRSFGK